MAGFPGAGLFGSISTSYIIDRLHMNQIACVESEFIVPGVIYAEGKLRHPFRLYSNERGDVCVLVCEAPVMIQGMYSVLDTGSKWVPYNNVREVMVFDGIAVEGLPDSKRISIVLSADEANLIHDYNIDATNKEKVDNVGSVYPTTAFVGGMSGGILSSCLSNGIASKVLIYASRGIPDPEGSILIESLGNIADNTSLKIDTAELRKQGAALKTRLEKIIQSYGEQQQRDQQEQVQS
ncbi:MAG: PAC2 family protein [Candidatus Nitrosopolaris sp.]